jgi:hypothetical protein
MIPIPTVMPRRSATTKRAISGREQPQHLDLRELEAHRPWIIRALRAIALGTLAGAPVTCCWRTSTS